VANQVLLSALTYAGYEVNHSWAEHAGHNDYHGSSIFPAALRWLWQGYPAPITAGTNSQQPVMRVLIPGAAWRRVGGRYSPATALAADAQGGVVFASPGDACLYRLDGDGRPKRWGPRISGVSALAFGPDGTLHACQPGKRRIVRISDRGRVTVWLKGIDAAGLGFAANGNGYVADPVKRRIWLVTPNGRRRVADQGIAAPRAVAVFGGQGQLIVTDARGPVSWQFMIQPDGMLAQRTPFFRPVIPDGETDGAVVDVAVSAKGWPVFATRAGLQLAMQAGGLITGLIPAPVRGPVDGVALGGTARDELYASCGGRIYHRKINLADSLWG
jgi:sugar lactone lactonase YvrE